MPARYPALVLAAVLLGGVAAAAAGARQEGAAALGDAGAAVGMMRLVADSVPPSSIMPELGELVSATSSFEGGFGLSNAGVNTAAELPFERSVAQATRFGAALTGRAPSSAGGLIQTAAPGNPNPSSGPLPAGENPVDGVVDLAELRGKVHARWSDARGPCIGTVADASTQTGAAWFGNAVPTLPDIDADELRLPGYGKPKQRRPLATLLGLLAGAEPAPNGAGALILLPRGLRTQSTVAVVDRDKAGKAGEAKVEHKAVRSTSLVKAAQIRLLPGGPLGMTATVRRSPTLAVTATGTPKTSRIEHIPPVITVRRGGTTLFTLDRGRPSRDIPIGVPTAGFAKAAGARVDAAGPIVDGVAEGRDGKAVRLSAKARREVVDLFVLRLTAGGLNSRSTALREPFAGHQVTASARLLDVQLLPTKELTAALGAGPRYDAPSTLLQFAVGEQVVRAAAPPGGARCGLPGAAAPSTALPAGLNTSSPAAGVRPLLWGGAALLLGGALVLVFLRPRRRGSQPTPTPAPRGHD